MQWAIEKAIRVATLDYSAEVHHGDARSDLANDRKIVSNEEVSNSELELKTLNKINNLCLDADIESTERLVADDQVRLTR